MLEPEPKNLDARNGSLKFEYRLHSPVYKRDVNTDVVTKVGFLVGCGADSRSITIPHRPY